MWLLNQPSSAARTALIYVTVGAMTVIWTGIWYLYLTNYPPETPAPYYWCGGLVLTGLTLIVIGLGLGHLGRAARHADMPSEIVTSPGMVVQPPITTAAPAPAPAVTTRAVPVAVQVPPLTPVNSPVQQTRLASRFRKRA